VSPIDPNDNCDWRGKPVLKRKHPIALGHHRHTDLSANLKTMETTRGTGAATLPELPRSARPADRLLAVATNLFSIHGIRAIGIDRILRESGCAKASLYSTYGSKEALVIAYLTEMDLADRRRFEQAAEKLADPVEKALVFFDLARTKGVRCDFPGCLYSNAASEFPGVRFEPIDAHRQWVRSTLTESLKAAGAASPGSTARQVQLLYDGALSASKVERSIEPIRFARRLAAQAIARARAVKA
jgi:AcrR family transcriptional regulator